MIEPTVEFLKIGLAVEIPNGLHAPFVELDIDLMSVAVPKSILEEIAKTARGEEIDKAVEVFGAAREGSSGHRPSDFTFRG
jgi:hypothetical protein